MRIWFERGFCQYSEVTDVGNSISVEEKRTNKRKEDNYGYLGGGNLIVILKYFITIHSKSFMAD